jgi:SAM-dependent methyltransferase/uncharacterized protein YbaR (Trm112 family)
MKQRLLEYLVCPMSGGKLELEVFKLEGDEIVEGALHSSHGLAYPIHGGVPSFVSTEEYTSAFGYEWNRHARIYFDGKDQHRVHSTSSQLVRKLGLSPEIVRGGIVMDVGCGTGANAATISEWGAREVFCVDLSSAVVAAFANTRRLKNVHVIQADLFRLPFAPNQFSTIFSIGVLHHTPETKKAFFALLPFLRNKGLVAIWVYQDCGGIQQRLSDKLRTITTKIKPKIIYGVCWLAVPAYYLYKIPLLGKLLFHFLPPVSKEPYWEDRILDTFDWYSPRYQWKHTYPQVYKWFKEADLEDIELLDVPISVRGRKKSELVE